MPTIDLADASLFGNEAAEDESEDIFSSYAVERQEIAGFLDPGKALQIIRAYKGEGKSALLRLVRIRLSAASPATLVISSTGAALSPALSTTDSDQWVRGWKTNLIRLAANEIGAKISFAFSDDAISLVEEAESNGFRARSFVSTLVDRLSSNTVPIERKRPGTADPERLLQRWSKNGSEVWFIIDDVDQNFENTPTHRIKIASFFIAARQLTLNVPEFRFRLAIRPNVWATVKREFEALSHVEQYIADLNWSSDDFEELLAKRIESYLERTHQLSSGKFELEADLQKRRRQLIALVLADQLAWGRDQTRRPAIVLHTLSRHRPRWLVELCKAAGHAAKKAKHERITFDDIEGQLQAFGKRRIEDTVAEFKSQCAQIEELLTAFAGKKESFSTDELIKFIRDSIMQGVHPKIVGVLGSPSHVEVAHFLFHIGFLTARKDFPNGSYEHISFANNPSLLSSRTNVDQGYSWEIHPVFRQALALKNVDRRRMD